MHFSQPGLHATRWRCTGLCMICQTASACIFLQCPAAGVYSWLPVCVTFTCGGLPPASGSRRQAAQWLPMQQQLPPAPSRRPAAPASAVASVPAPTHRSGRIHFRSACRCRSGSTFTRGCAPQTTPTPPTLCCTKQHHSDIKQVSSAASVPPGVVEQLLSDARQAALRRQRPRHPSSASRRHPLAPAQHHPPLRHRRRPGRMTAPAPPRVAGPAS